MPQTNAPKSTFKVANPGGGQKLSQAQLAFMKLAENENLKRVAKIEHIRKKNWWVGWTLGLTALGIYGYTIINIKQEKFLDDFNEPEKVIDIKN